MCLRLQFAVYSVEQVRDIGIMSLRRHTRGAVWRLVVWTDELLRQDDLALSSRYNETSPMPILTTIIKQKTSVRIREWS